MSKIVRVFAVLIFTYGVCFSQSIIIEGKADAYKNKSIGVWVKKDYISNIEKQLTYSEIDSSGHFLVEFDNKEILYVTLKIEKHIASMYVEPKGCYEIIIMPPDSTTYQNPDIEHDVNISIRLSKKNEINALTMDYDKRFDEFLSNEYPSFVSRMPKQKIDSFKVSIFDFYSTVNNSYFKNYITYSIAALEEKTNFSRKKLFAEYIDGKPILYNHPEYFNFFNTFYKNFLQNLSTSKKVLKIYTYIEKKCDLTRLMNILKQEEFLGNDTVRELVLIKGLYESYFDGYFYRDSVVKMLEMIRDSTSLDKHKIILQNILSSFSKLRVGEKAPFFELPDKTGLTHSLDEIRYKKYVYIVFFKTSCTSCLQQIKVMSSYKKKYGKQIEFVGVCEDPEMKQFKEFCFNNPQINWLLLYDNTGSKLKSNYEISSYPTYFLLNFEGEFIQQVPADSPEQYIERTFIDLTKPKNTKVKVGDKKNK